MTRRITALLVALVAVLGLAVSAPQPAAADGIAGDGVTFMCRSGAGLLGNLALELTDSDLCEKIGEGVQKKVDEAWRSVWDSALGDFIKSASDVAKWVIKKTLTVALAGPSVDLKATGLFGRDATLAGMLMWLGLVIATAGVIWNLGKMALTGQTKHLGRSLLGWVENLLLSAVGVALFALLLTASDKLTTGLVNAVFADDDAYKRIVAVLIPASVQNPATLLGVVAVLLLVGFIQMIMVFLRQSAIPIICLLLPVAAGGRTGGETTRQWAPKLITSGLVIITYKPILAVIICTGFAEFGKAATLAEWLRGCATLVLGVLAPGPLTKIFAPFGAAVGEGMSSGGAGGALGAAANYMGNRGRAGADGGGDGGGAQPATPVSHAQYVQQHMPRPGGPNGPAAPEPGAPAQGPRPGTGQGRSSVREHTTTVPGQTPVPAGGGTPAGTGGSRTPEGHPGTARGATTASAAPVVAGGIQVLDGINDRVQQTSQQIGGGTQ